MSALRCVATAVLVLGMVASSLAMADWKNLWKSPEQRAMQAYENGEFTTLMRDAPDDSWSALGQFQSEDYSGASQTFGSRAEQLRSEGDASAANTALYNQGVSEVMAGQFQQAIELFDEVLTQDPAFTDAEHNRLIARELLELQQQQQQQQQQNESGDNGDQDQQGEQGESGNQQEGQSQDSDQSAQRQPEEGEGDDSRDASGNENAENNAEQSAQNDASSDASQNDDAADAEDAREALAAEAAQQDEQQQNDQGSIDEGMNGKLEQPLSEAEQATEQLLRRIPDDPAGLLRRKLEQSHRNDYPEVRDAAEPW